jgi:hypothetical protein
MEHGIIRTIISAIIGLLLSMVFNVEPALAQTENRQIKPLSEANYACFQQLNCVANSEALKEKGWNVQFDETIKNYPQARTARMSGDGLEVTARYDKDGKLLSGMYELHNTALPRVLLAHLADNSFKGWAMTGNKITVRNFNAATTTYQVTLANESEKKTVRFSYADVLGMTSNKNESLAENQQK